MKKGNDSTEPEKDTQAQDQKTRSIPKGVLRRMSRLALTSAKGSARIAMAGPRGLLSKDAQKLFEQVHVANAKDMANALGRLKGTAMKLGQFASFVDADVLPQEVRDIYQGALAKLRDSAPPMGKTLTRAVIKDELGGRPEDLFASFDGHPCAAASLGQVHLATLKDGREVAVKLQYPGVAEAVRSDLAATSILRPLLPLLAPGLQADEALQEIRQRVTEELDYRKEAATLEGIASHFEGHPFVCVPRPVMEMTTQRLLVMERVEGRPFSEILKLPQTERDRVGELLFRFYYGALHRFGVTSADPHPGNYLLMSDGRLACFDFGLSVSLDPKLRPELLQTLQAAKRRDPQELFERCVNLGYTRADSPVDPGDLLDWVSFSMEPVLHDGRYTFTRDYIARRTGAILDPRSDWFSVIRQLNLPRWAVLLTRLELGLFAVLAQLGATADWNAITMEFYGSRACTPIGEQEAAWLAARDNPLLPSLFPGLPGEESQSEEQSRNSPPSNHP